MFEIASGYQSAILVPRLDPLDSLRPQRTNHTDDQVALGLSRTVDNTTLKTHVHAPRLPRHKACDGVDVALPDALVRRTQWDGFGADVGQAVEDVVRKRVGV